MQNFLGFLQKSQDARRIFGKRELKIIEKQAWGVNLTQSEKNRLSRDIRKKLNFIQEASRFIEEFELKKGTALNKEVNEMLETIKEDRLFGKITKVWLYGSTAKKERALRSDIDMAVEFDGISEFEGMEFRKRVLGNLTDKADVQVYSLLAQKLKEEVQRGKVVYERKN